MEHSSPLGDDLRQRRRSAGLTQEDLARRSGVSPRTITDLERGIVQAPHEDTLVLLAQALDVSGEDLRTWRKRRARGILQRSGDKPVRVEQETGLPPAPNPLIGREREIGELSRLITSEGVRLVTVTGPGGVGKTRVALQVARTLEPEFQDGSRFVDLTRLRDPREVVPAIAERLGLQDVSGPKVTERVASYLARRNLLLLIDNFEHLLRAAPDLARLISVQSGSSFVVTSRARLQLQFEHEFPVSTLSLPEKTVIPHADDAFRLPAVRLFAERARQVNPAFQMTSEDLHVVVEICRRLDGLPLAIELAAARTRILSPVELLARLEDRFEVLAQGFRDVPDRHRTMRDAIGWSYDLLREPEQRLFRQLSVFVGGWTLHAAESINPSGDDVLAHLTTLLDSNLIYRTGSPGQFQRFGMLESIREFGRNQIRRTDELKRVRADHARYFRDFALKAVPELLGPDPSPWLDEIERDLPNFRTALDWAHSECDGDSFGAELASAISWYWLRLQGNMAEARRLIDRALERAPVNSAARMKALAGNAWVAKMQQDCEPARAYATDALAIARKLGDDWYVAWSHHLLGRIAYFEGNASLALSCATESLHVARVLGDEWLIGWSYQLLGIGYFIGGDLTAARSHLESSLETWQQIDDQPGIAALHALLGVVTRLDGHDRDALALFQQSLRRYRALGARWFAANFIAEVVTLAARLGELERAARLSGFVEEGWDLIGAGPAPFTQESYALGKEIIRARLSTQVVNREWTNGQRLTLHEAIDEALRVGQAGEAEDAAGDFATPPTTHG